MPGRPSNTSAWSTSLLAGCLSPEAALAPGAPRVHPDHDNLLSRSAIVRGDVDAALAASAFVETRTFTTQLIEHAFLEPESCLAVPRRGSGLGARASWAGSEQLQVANPESRASSPESRAPSPVLEVFSQGQGVFDDRRQIASFLGVAEGAVKVTLVSNGGAFGGKEDLSIQGQTALMAVLTGRPVKATLTRDESIRLHPKRHPMTLHYTVGCDARRPPHRACARASSATRARSRRSARRCSSARPGTPPGRTGCRPSTSSRWRSTRTTCPAAPCAGSGPTRRRSPSRACSTSSRSAPGLDGWEMRWRNALDAGDTFCTGQVLEHAVGLKDTLLAVKDAYYGSPRAGIACGIKNVGIGNGMPEAGQAVVDVTADGQVVIHTGFTEMGQGFYTAMVQCLCDITGIDPRLVRTEVDTAHPTPCGMTTASRATVLGGRAVQDAARKLKADLAPASSSRTWRDAATRASTAPARRRRSGADTPHPRTHMTYGFATQVCILDERGRVERVVAAHDVGKVINRHMVEGQIEGAVHMGLGYALTEDLPLVDGVPESFRLRSLGLIRARDMPDVTVILVESNDPEGPFGAKGVGEIGLVPTAGAVANALYRFDGIRRTSLPMKDSAAARAMGSGARD